MAKQFHFDDEDMMVEEDSLDRNQSVLDEFEKIKDKQEDTQDIDVIPEFIGESVVETFEEVEEEDQSMAKKKLKFKWRWWYYIIIVFLVLVIAFAIYIFLATRNDGPVYGNRCEGIVEIPLDAKQIAVKDVKEKYSEIEDITFETTCKQLKVDIVFKDDMDTTKAQQIAEDAVQTLDSLANQSKNEGQTYSNLFGYIDNVPQYEVNFFLVSQGNEDFPIYGTKHVSQDSFSYTLSSIRDQDSYDKARDTLEEKAE